MLWRSAGGTRQEGCCLLYSEVARAWYCVWTGALETLKVTLLQDPSPRLHLYREGCRLLMH